MSTRLISEIASAACYCYSPRGTSEEAVKSRKLCGLLKSGDSKSIDRMADRVRRLTNDGIFQDYFTNDTSLVPVPGSAPIRNKSTPWISEQLCETLLASGLAREVLRIASREVSVPKSAYQPRGGRPSARNHFESFNVRREIESHARFLLVDDVVTKGSTILGLASRLQEAYPDAEMRAFAMIRTMGLQDDIERINDPIENGRITLVGEAEAYRYP